MTQPQELNRELTLAGEIAELIGVVGPMHHEDIASRLGVASRHRFKEAVKHLLQTGKAERFADCEPGLRIVGDHRPIPARSLHQLASRRRRGKRGGRACK